jgi:hypothetical protein
MPDSPDVKIQISAEDQGVAAAVKELSAQLQGLKAQEQEVADATLNLADAFEGLLGVLAVEKLVEFGKEVFDTTTSILKLSQVTGISTETLSVYASAAAKAGVSFDVVGGGITKLGTVITQFEQGNQRAAKAIALTGLSLKDLAGLNSEQKLRAITDAIARMPAGFQKTTVETKLLGDGSGALNKVLNELAGDGFEKTREEAEKMGTIVGSQTAEDFETLRRSLASLKEASAGIVMQFEAGIVPALTDVANAILRVTATDGVSGFKSFGETAGDVLKKLVLISYAVFGGIEKIVNGAIDGTENLAKAALDVFRIGPAAAAAALKANQAADDKFIDDMVDHQLAAVRTELDGTTRLQQEAIDKQRAMLDKNKGKEPPVENLEAIKGILKLQAAQDAAFKAHTTALNKALTAEETISKAFQANREEGAKADFDKGLISLADYFDARRLEIEQAGKEELSLLTEQRANEVKAEARAKAEAAANRSKGTAAGGADTQIGQEYQAAAAKNQAEAARAAQAIADLDTKITVQEIANKTKLSAEDLERYKAEQEQLTKLAEFQKTILDIQGKTAEAAKAESAAKIAEYRTLLTSQKGETPESIELKVQAYVKLTTAVAAFNDAKKAGETALKAQSDAEAAIQLKVASGQIFQIQADAQIKALKLAQLATLQQIATAQMAAAKATGNQADIEAAASFQTVINAQAVANNQAMEQAKELKKGLQDAVQGSLDDFFARGITGSRNLGQAFAKLADGVIGSLQKMAAQIVSTKLTEELFKAIPGLGGGSTPAADVAAASAKGTAQAAPLTAAATALTVAGTTLTTGAPLLTTGATELTVAAAALLPGAAAVAAAAVALQAAADTMMMAEAAGGGLAAGGLVSGPGGPTSDSIPARLSAGEFVFKASAVRSIGPAVLAAMNRGLPSPTWSAPIAVQKFAEGGLVEGTGGGTDPVRVHMQLGLDEGIVLKHMSSSAGGKVVVQHLANNPKSASKALGRGK